MLAFARVGGGGGGAGDCETDEVGADLSLHAVSPMNNMNFKSDLKDTNSPYGCAKLDCTKMPSVARWR